MATLLAGADGRLVSRHASDTKPKEAKRETGAFAEAAPEAMATLRRLLEANDIQAVIRAVRRYSSESSDSSERKGADQNPALAKPATDTLERLREF